MKKYILIIIVLLSINVYSETVSLTHISNAELNPIDEWMNPGKYSPYNLIDGDSKTFYGSSDYMYGMGFEYIKNVNIDKIVIKEMVDNLGVKCQELNVILFNSNELEEKNKVLDQKYLTGDSFIHEIKFDKSYSVKHLTIFFLKIFDVEKNNQTKIYISEIEFYNNGEKIEFSNVEQLKKEYVVNIGKRLNKLLSGNKFEVVEYDTEVTFSKDGKVLQKNTTKDKDFWANIPATKWKVENNKLYFYNKNKWEIVNYNIIETNPGIAVNYIGNKKYNFFFRKIK